MPDTSHSNHSDVPQRGESWLFSRTGIATVVALAVLGFLVYTGHSAHLLGFVPYLFILACPLMHVFMHGGHHGHRHHHDQAPDARGANGDWNDDHSNRSQ